MTDPTAPLSPPAPAPGAAAPPAPAPAAPAAPLSVEDARAAIEVRKADKEFYKRLNAPDPEVSGAARREWDALHEAGYPPLPEITLESIKDLPANHELRRNAEQMDRHLLQLRQMGVRDPVALDEVRRGQPIAAAEQQDARDEIASLKRDKAWVRRYLDGGREESERFTRLHKVISLPTARTPTTYPVK
jgi:hypothetical protein